MHHTPFNFLARQATHVVLWLIQKDYWPHLNQASSWLVFTLFGMLFPVLASWFLLKGLNYDPKLENFTDAGQFSFYSAALWVTTFYLIVKPSWARLDATPGLAFLYLVGYSCSLIIFCLGSIVSAGGNGDGALVRWPSLLFFAFAIIVAFLAILRDERRTSTDPRAVQTEAQAKLTQDFRSSEGG